MGSLNKVQLIGRLGQDPEIKYTDSGKNVANVSLATSETWKDQSGEKQEKTEWHKLVIWDRLATLAENYLKKGSQIYAEGSIQTRDYMKDDEKRYITEVKVYKIEFLSSMDSPSSIDPPSYADSQREILRESSDERVVTESDFNEMGKVGQDTTPEPRHDTWHDRQEPDNDQLNIKRIQSKFIDAGAERRSETEPQPQQGVKDDIPF